MHDIQSCRKDSSYHNKDWQSITDNTGAWNENDDLKSALIDYLMDCQATEEAEAVRLSEEKGGVLETENWAYRFK